MTPALRGRDRQIIECEASLFQPARANKTAATKTNKREFFKRLSYVYKCFIWISLSAPCMCLVLKKVRIWFQIF